MHPVIKRLAEHLEREKISQRQAAAELGIDPMTLNRYLHGQIQRPHRNTLRTIESWLNQNRQTDGFGTITIDNVTYDVILRRR